MILLCNGDSWTQGDSPAQTPNWNAKPNLDWYNIIPDFGEHCNFHPDRVLYKFYDSDIWPKVLGKKLGVETWNCGRLGASNDKIIRTTINSIEYLESLGKTDIFVVIGLTSINRYSNLELNYSYEELRIESDNINPVLVQKNLVNLINIQNYLSMKGYDYLIFNAFDTLMEDDFKSLPLYQYIDFDKIYNNDLTAHFRNYIDNKFNTMWHVNGKHYQAAHPTDFSHIEWGNELHKYIKENYNV
jgi:hypothetical protein